MEQKIALEFRVLETMMSENRYRYVGEAFFLFPAIFSGDDRRKFPPVMAYWLTQGVISHVVRDKFTSGGRETHGGVEVPQIINRAIKRRHEIKDAAGRIEEDTINRHWGCNSAPKNTAERLSKWLDMVKIEYMTNVNGYSQEQAEEHLRVLRQALEIT